MDVRPHPHINLSTLTYLFEGAIDHRDSLGTYATIRPGACNLMTAGRGIVHSERTPQGERSEEHTSELQSLMRITYAVFCLKTKRIKTKQRSKTECKTN